MKQFVKAIFIIVPVFLVFIFSILNIKVVKTQNGIISDDWPNDDGSDFSELQWLAIVKELAHTPGFLHQLSEAQAQVLDSVYQKLFEDNLVIRIEDNQSLLDTISGLALAVDLESLLAGKQVKINVHVDDYLSEADGNLMDKYIEDHLLHEYLFYRFNIRVVQIIDGHEMPLNIVHPIMISQDIPYQLQYRGLLKALTINQGSLSELPLEETSEGKFILRVDKLSAFAIFSSAVVEEGEDPVVGVVGTRIPDYVWWLGGLAILLLALGVYMAIKKKVV